MYISRGNIKVKCNIWSLPCRITCKPNMACYKYCYAAKAERIYPQVKPCRLSNLEASKRPDFINKTIELLKTRRNKIVRIHESGDFYNETYIKAWYKIAESLPEYKFYAYTKRDDLFNKDLLKLKPSNMILILSLDGVQKRSSFKVPAGFNKLAVTHASSNNCPAIDNKNVKCMIDCKKCISNKKEIIIFRKH